MTNSIIFSVRIVNILGTSLPVQIYKEAQQIECNGGMLIMVSAQYK